MKDCHVHFETQPPSKILTIIIIIVIILFLIKS